MELTQEQMQVVISGLLLQQKVIQETLMSIQMQLQERAKQEAQKAKDETTAGNK